MNIRQYAVPDKQKWNSFNRESKNGHFIFDRDYMEYHADRFDDFSLLLYDNKSNLVALLPGHKDQENFVSHGGLTYGGFITDATIKTPSMVSAMAATLEYLQRAGFKTFRYKTIPFIHQTIPADEDRYALFLANASLKQRNVMSVVSKHHLLPFQERRKRGAKKALKSGLTVAFSEEFNEYWNLLTTVLAVTHKSKPVHSIEEIVSLKEKFPDNIRLVTVMKQRTIVAGVVLFISRGVARTQYIAASDEGKAMGALDLCFDYLLFHNTIPFEYFDFGTSHRGGSEYLNTGLVEQKEGYGARTVTTDIYEIDLTTTDISLLTGALA